MTTTPGPRTQPHEQHAHLTPCAGGLNPDYTCSQPIHVCEARADVDGLVARLREAVEALPGRCHDGEGLGCETFPCVENVSRAAVLALLAGDKAEAPLTLTVNSPAVETTTVRVPEPEGWVNPLGYLAGDKAEAPLSVDDGLRPNLPTLAGDKAEAPE